MDKRASEKGEPVVQDRDTAPLANLKVIDLSLLGPAGLGQVLADIGADVLKIEPPSGDHIRGVGWPVVDGASQLHWHLNRGKRSLALDLKSPEGRETFLRLIAVADILVEGMRPGMLDKLGIGWKRLQDVNPRLVYCAISGFGSIGPYASLASHGLGFDAWGTTAPPSILPDGTCQVPDNITAIGFTAGPLYGAIAALAGVIRARETGTGCRFEVSQAGAAAAFAWTSIEGENALREGLVSQGTADITPGAAGMTESVRYQYYRTSDGFVLFMGTERKFWKNFCAVIGRNDLYADNPGTDYDHDRGNWDLRRELARIFLERTTGEWTKLGVDENIPIVPVNTPKSILDDPHFLQTMAWLPVPGSRNRTLGFPARFPDMAMPQPGRAPALNEGGAEALSDWLGSGATAEQGK